MLPGKGFAASQCPFCRMIGISMLSGGYGPKTLEYPTHFYLDVGELHEADEIAASVLRINPYEDDISLTFMVDLQIVTRHGSEPKNA
jgi:hypothetical protein